MNTAILGLLAETPIHPGTGRGMGVVDLPVAREAATDYPVLVGSSLKGALKDKMAAATEEERNTLFGAPDRAGDLLVADARLLLLPVRSLTGSYRWATCPHLVERYCRDLERTGLQPRPKVPKVKCGSVLTTGTTGGGDPTGTTGTTDLFLEERQFTIGGEPPDDLVEAVQPLLLHEETRDRLPHQLAILHDDDFAWFARYGLAIQARNVLKSETKKSTNLWYEETLPPDTVMYALVAGRGDRSLDSLGELFPERDRYLQAGGNETVGQGWFAVTVRRSDTEGTQ